MANAIPAGVPAEAAEAARSTLGGAVSVASQLPGTAGIDILNAAHAAFSQSLELTALVSAALAIVIAVIITTVLRDVQPGSGEPEEEAERTGDLEAIECAVS
jgi:DHA2 family multidrug resistance protein-like MFS transporter